MALREIDQLIKVVEKNKYAITDTALYNLIRNKLNLIRRKYIALADKNYELVEEVEDFKNILYLLKKAKNTLI